MAKGYINKEQLSEELQNEIENSGMTEEQVNEIVDEAIGDLSQLNTNAKGNLVEALNELFQNANNGKQIIADAIGSPLNSENTFAAMGNDIEGLLSTFKTNMLNNGVVIEAEDKFQELINKIATMNNNTNNIQFAEGVATISNSIIEHNCGFIPQYFFVKGSSLALRHNQSDGSYRAMTLRNPVASNLGLMGNALDISTFGLAGGILISEVTETTAKIQGISGVVNWYAIGVGSKQEIISVESTLPTSGHEDDFVIICENPEAEGVLFDLKTSNRANLPEQGIIICIPHDMTMLRMNMGVIPVDLALGEVYYKNGTEYTELEVYQYKNGNWRLYSNNIVVSKFFTNHPYTYTEIDFTTFKVNDLSVGGSVNSLWSAGIRISGLPVGRYKFMAEVSVGISRTVAGNVYINEYQAETTTNFTVHGGTFTLVTPEINATEEFSLTITAAGSTANISSLSLTNAKLIRIYD